MLCIKNISNILFELSYSWNLLCQSSAAMTSQDEFKAIITLVFKMLGVYQLFSMLSESKNVSLAFYDPIMFKDSWIIHVPERKRETRVWLEDIFCARYLKPYLLIHSCD